MLDANGCDSLWQHSSLAGRWQSAVVAEPFVLLVVPEGQAGAMWRTMCRLVDGWVGRRRGQKADGWMVCMAMGGGGVMPNGYGQCHLHHCGLHLSNDSLPTSAMYEVVECLQHEALDRVPAKPAVAPSRHPRRWESSACFSIQRHVVPACVPLQALGCLGQRGEWVGSGGGSPPLAGCGSG